MSNDTAHVTRTLPPSRLVMLDTGRNPLQNGYYAGALPAEARPRGPLITERQFALPPVQRVRECVSDPPPIGQRRCPVCGVPMFMACIEPTDEPGKIDGMRVVRVRRNDSSQIPLAECRQRPPAPHGNV